MHWLWLFYLEKMVRQMFWFPKYTFNLLFAEEINWITVKKSLNNYDFVFVNNYFINNHSFVEEGV